MINYIIETTKKTRRFSFDIILFLFGLSLLLTGLYVDISNPAQLLLFKVVTISAGVIHGHIAGKLIFPKVDWELPLSKASAYGRIAIYVVVILGYTFGG